MTATASDHDQAVRFYARLVALYPKAHRDSFGPQMQRTFEDSYRNATEGERRVALEFWLAVLWDEGRSIVRERAAEPQGDVLFFGVVLLWVCGVMFLPVIPALNDWHKLLLPTVVLAVLLLAIPGHSGIARRLATICVAVAAVESMAAVPQSMRDQMDFLAPVLLVACMTFSIKTLTGLNARIVGVKDGVWSREELVYGGLAGLAGVAGLAISAVDTSDSNPTFPFFFYVAVPFVCAVAGFRSSRRNVSMRSGIYAALGSMMIAVAIWFLALPLVIDGALLTVFHGHPASALLPIFWQRPLSSILFWAALNGMAAAFLGIESLRTGGKVPQSPS